MGSNSIAEHILMLPFMARGHLIPFLELAKKIHKSTGFTITILNTPLNIQYLRSKLDDDDGPAAAAAFSSSSSSSSNIRLVELPFSSSDHGLPPNVEGTQSLSLAQLIDLFYASLTLEAPLRKFIDEQVVAKEGRPPLCIVSDVFFGWAFDVAKSVGSVGIAFSTCGAYGTAGYVSVWKDLPHLKTIQPNGTFTLPWFPENHQFHITQLHRFLRTADGSDIWSKFFQPQLTMATRASGWLINTVEEIEPLGLSIIRNYLKLPVWPIGPILPKNVLSAKPPSPRKCDDQNDEECISWLDQQLRDFVLYICFGSQNSINPAQMMELAKGLEKSGNPFLWVIRPPYGFDPDGEFREEWLPQGFEKRVRERKQGILVKKWAPQLEILCHESTGAFLSHCGWNSVLESLSQGVPIIGWPLAAEQAYNSKMLSDEMGVAIELTRGLEGEVTEEGVREVVEVVLGRDGKGGEMKRAAVEVGEKLRMAVMEGEHQRGSSVKAMDDFVEAVISMRYQNLV